LFAARRGARPQKIIGESAAKSQGTARKSHQFSPVIWTSAGVAYSTFRTIPMAREKGPRLLAVGLGKLACCKDA
jgi:hypothetical protein